MSTQRIGLLSVLLLISLFSPVVYGSYVQYSEEYGIYRFDIESGETQLIYSSPEQLSNLDLSQDHSTFALSIFHGEGYEYSDVYTMNVDGSELTRLTDNSDWDLYPVWSPDTSEILFLSWRDTSLDIYRMDSDGSNQRLFYDSGGHDGDLDWVDDSIVFTRDSQIWLMNSDGSNIHQLTDPADAGVWGDSVLPFGDYDPRISPDGSLVVFERLVDDASPHGNYDLFVIGTDGSDEHNITGLGWTLGIAQWSSTGEALIYLVSAIGEEGRYDVYRVKADGSGVVDLTSEHFPPGFIVNSPVYGEDDSTLYLIGQWWDWKILDSTLTCSVSKSTASLGETVKASISLAPEVHDINVQVTVTAPDGTETMETVTLADGSYKLNITPDQVGEYSVQAEWEGDLGHTASSSSPISFTIGEETPPDDGGVPGFPSIALLFGLFVYLVVRQFYQRARLRFI